MANTSPNPTQEQLRFLYDKLLSLLINETSLISERTNIFLVFNTILFAAFVILKAQVTPQTNWTLAGNLTISVSGLIFCLLFHYLIRAAIRAAKIWRGLLNKIEGENVFWDGITNPAEFRIFPTNNAREPLPTKILGKYLPLIMAVLWGMALIWTIFGRS